MALLEFLRDENNRAILLLLGAGSSAVIAGLWAVFKFVRTKDIKGSVPTVSASNRSVAAGRDIRDTKINDGRK
jgi:hypothetical protein